MHFYVPFMIKGGKFEEIVVRRWWRRANARNVSFKNSYDGRFTFKILHLSLFTVDKTKLSMCTLIIHEYQLFDVIFFTWLLGIERSSPVSS